MYLWLSDYQCHFMKERFQKVSQMESTGVVVLRGEGSNFCSGADLSMVEEVFSMRKFHIRKI